VLPKELIRTVFAAETVYHNGKPGKAEAVCSESPAGGRVFNASTNDWAHGLTMLEDKGVKFRKLIENLVLQFLSFPGR
jgi:hypothetical protein